MRNAGRDALNLRGAPQGIPYPPQAIPYKFTLHLLNFIENLFRLSV